MADFDFDAWVVNGTVRTEDVKLNNRHDAAYYERAESLVKELAEAESDNADKDSLEAVGADVDDVLARMEALEAEYSEHDVIVTVRALEPAVARRIALAHMSPPKPRPVPQDAPQKAHAKYQNDLLKWLTKDADVRSERDLEFISEAVDKVMSASGTTNAISVESLRAMRDRPHGPHMIKRLINAVNKATNGEDELDRPKSPEPSTKDSA